MIVARVLVVLGLSLVFVAPARAAAPPVPASYYPPTTRLEYFPTLTNRQFDCIFGWDCDNNLPFLHILTEERLHRMQGWAMWGHWRNDRMGFEIYSSVYGPPRDAGGPGWNQYAASDEAAALDIYQHAMNAMNLPAVLPCGVVGKTFAKYVDKPGWHVFLLTVWWGANQEVEAAAVYPASKKAEARRYLIMQVRAAVQMPLDAIANQGRATGQRQQWSTNGSCP